MSYGYKKKRSGSSAYSRGFRAGMRKAKYGKRGRKSYGRRSW